MNLQATPETKQKIPDLIAELGDGDSFRRQRARLLLAQLEPESLPALLDALESPRAEIRREAVSVLGEIHNPETAPALTNMLMDEETSVRWAAMEGLINKGRESLRPILEKFIKHFDSIWLREGVHHILRVLKDRHELNEREIALFEKLDEQLIPGFEPSWNGQEAWAAEKALELLDQVEIQSR